MDVYGDQPADRCTNFRPSFHRPFLDVEDSSLPEKMYKSSGNEYPNGVCVVPVRTGSLPTTVQETPCCTSDSQSVGNLDKEGTDCEASKCDETGDCDGGSVEVRDEDSGRDRRLNAALGLISLADVSSDVAEDQLTSCTQTSFGDCSTTTVTHFISGLIGPFFLDLLWVW